MVRVSDSVVFRVRVRDGFRVRVRVWFRVRVSLVCYIVYCFKYTFFISMQFISTLRLKSSF